MDTNEHPRNCFRKIESHMCPHEAECATLPKLNTLQICGGELFGINPEWVLDSEDLHLGSNCKNSLKQNQSGQFPENPFCDFHSNVRNNNATVKRGSTECNCSVCFDKMTQTDDEIIESDLNKHLLAHFQNTLNVSKQRQTDNSIFEFKLGISKEKGETHSQPVLTDVTPISSEKSASVLFRKGSKMKLHPSSKKSKYFSLHKSYKIKSLDLKNGSRIKYQTSKLHFFIKYNRQDVNYKISKILRGKTSAVSCKSFRRRKSMINDNCFTQNPSSVLEDDKTNLMNDCNSKHFITPLHIFNENKILTCENTLNVSNYDELNCIKDAFSSNVVHASEVENNENCNNENNSPIDSTKIKIDDIAGQMTHPLVHEGPIRRSSINSDIRDSSPRLRSLRNPPYGTDISIQASESVYSIPDTSEGKVVIALKNTDIDFNISTIKSSIGINNTGMTPARRHTISTCSKPLERVDVKFEKKSFSDEMFYVWETDLKKNVTEAAEESKNVVFGKFQEPMILEQSYSSENASAFEDNRNNSQNSPIEILKTDSQTLHSFIRSFSYVDSNYVQASKSYRNMGMSRSISNPEYMSNTSSKSPCTVKTSPKSNDYSQSMDNISTKAQPSTSFADANKSEPHTSSCNKGTNTFPEGIDVPFDENFELLPCYNEESVPPVTAPCAPLQYQQDPKQCIKCQPTASQYNLNTWIINWGGCGHVRPFLVYKPQCTSQPQGLSSNFANQNQSIKEHQWPKAEQTQHVAVAGGVVLKWPIATALLSLNNLYVAIATTLLSLNNLYVAIATTLLSLNNLYVAIATTLLSLNNKYVAIATTFLSLNNKYVAIATTLLSLNNKYVAIATTFLSLNNKYVAIATTFLSLNNKYVAIATTLLSPNNLYVAIATTFLSLNNLYVAITTTFLSLNNLYVAIATTLLSHNNLYVAIATTLLNLNNKYVAIATTLLNLNNKYVAIATALLSLNNKYVAIATTFLSLNNKYVAIATTFLSLNNKYVAIATTLLSLNNKYVAIATTFLSLNNKYVAIATTFLSLNNKYVAIATTLLSLNNKYVAIATTLLSLNNLYVAIATTLLSLNNLYVAIATTLLSLNNKYVAIATTLLSLNNLYVAIATTFLSLNNQYVAIATTFLNLNNKYVAIATTFLSLNNKYVAIATTFLSLNNLYVAITTTFLSLGNKYVPIATTFLSLNNKYVAIATTFLSLNNLYVAIATTFLSLNNLYVAIATTFLSLNNKYVAIATMFLSLYNKYVAIATTFLSLNNKYVAIATMLLSLNNLYVAIATTFLSLNNLYVAITTMFLSLKLYVTIDCHKCDAPCNECRVCEQELEDHRRKLLEQQRIEEEQKLQKQRQEQIQHYQQHHQQEQHYQEKQHYQQQQEQQQQEHYQEKEQYQQHPQQEQHYEEDPEKEHCVTEYCTCCDSEQEGSDVDFYPCKQCSEENLTRKEVCHCTDQCCQKQKVFITEPKDNKQANPPAMETYSCHLRSSGQGQQYGNNVQYVTPQREDRPGNCYTAKTCLCHAAAHHWTTSSSGQNQQSSSGQNQQPCCCQNQQPCCCQNQQPCCCQNQQPCCCQNQQSSSVQNQQSSFGQNQQLSFGQNQQLSFGQNQQSSFGQNQQSSFGQNQQSSFSQNQQSSFGQNQQSSFGQNQQSSFGQNQQSSFGQNHQTSSVQNQQLSFGQNQQSSFGQNQQSSFGQNQQPCCCQNQQPCCCQNQQSSSVQNQQSSFGQNPQPCCGQNPQPSSVQNPQPCCGQNPQPCCCQNPQPCCCQNQQPCCGQNQQSSFGQNQQSSFGQNHQTSSVQNQQSSFGQNQQSSFGQNQQSSFGQNQQSSFGQNHQTSSVQNQQSSFGQNKQSSSVQYMAPHGSCPYCFANRMKTMYNNSSDTPYVTYKNPYCYYQSPVCYSRSPFYPQVSSYCTPRTGTIDPYSY
ncbi:hypothetical protein Ahia01_001254100 [Argonauta hians]